MIPLRPYGASTLVTARGEYPIPLTPVGNRGDCLEQLERARQRREVRAYPILNPNPTPPEAIQRPRSTNSKRFNSTYGALLRREYEAGATVKTLAARHFASSDTVTRAIKDAGGTMRKSAPPKIAGPTPEQVQVMVAGYAAGASLKALARKHGWHTVTISNHLRAAGVTLRPAASTATPAEIEQRRRVVADYEAGHRTSDIARRYGIDARTVARNVHAAGKAIRTQEQITEIARKARA